MQTVDFTPLWWTTVPQNGSTIKEGGTVITLGKQPRRPRKRKKGLLILIVFLLSISVGTIAGALAGYIGNVPTLDQVVFDPKLTTTIYDVKERPIATLFIENRVPVKLREVPQILIDAFLAVEDRDFYRHRGFDLSGIARAALSIMRSGEITEGGSTITQQLAKLSFLTHERTWSRKINELFWSIQIERKYTKDEILQTYLNTVYYGHGTYGVEAASQFFFGKSVREIDLPEAALLAGIPNGPAFFSPYLSMDGALRRRNLVLRRMHDAGYLSRAEYEAAIATEIKVIGERRTSTQAPYFVRYINKELQQKLGFDANYVHSGGLKVFTTLDLDIQRAAENAIEQWVDTKETDHRGLIQPQASIVTLDVRSGRILAWVGGRGGSGDPLDRVNVELRQPGSAFKPFVYATAIESRKYTPATIRVDEPTTFRLVTGETYSPSNNDNTFAGPVTLRKALEQSINVVATQLIDEVDPREVIKVAKRLGISSLVESGPINDLTLSSALGGLTQGVSALEMAAAYAVFAHGGIYSEPTAILRVEAPNGLVLYEAPPPKQSVVLSPETSYIITDMMRGVIERGTGVSANIGRPAAGKTGTSDDYVDGWFVGYTPDLVTAVWIGNDNKSPMRYPDGRIIGSATAARTWRAMMQEAVRNTPATDFSRPNGIVGPLTIDVTNGKLIAEQCANVPLDEQVVEIFIETTEPKDVSERCSTLLTPPRGLFRWFQ